MVIGLGRAARSAAAKLDPDEHAPSSGETVLCGVGEGSEGGGEADVPTAGSAPPECDPASELSIAATEESTMSTVTAIASPR